MLKLKLLGKIRIEYLGVDLEPQLSSKTIALIYLLAANKGKAISKSKIMLYLWPDSSEEAARYNLRYNLWDLKKVLPLDKNNNSLILSEKDSCTINEEYPLDCDMWSIKSFNCKNATIEELLSINEIFDGDIMEGWYLKNCNEFNEHVIYDRMTCDKIHMNILNELVVKYGLQGQHKKAIEVLEQMAHIEPDNEEIALNTMKLYALEGNRTAAINYYKTFEINLWKGIGLSPNEKLRNFFDSLYCDNHVENSKVKSSSIRIEEERWISIQGFSIEGIDFFLVSDIISKLLKKIDKIVLSNLDEEIVLDLMEINKKIYIEFCKATNKMEIQNSKQIGSPVPVVRIITSFVSFVEHIMESYKIEINIENNCIDELSKKTIEYLETLDKNRLIINKNQKEE